MQARRGVYAWAAAAAGLVAAVTLLVVPGSGASNWPTPAISQLTHLNPLPGKPAPGFTLVDQLGRHVSLASLRGRVVVIEPMDPKCTSVCPLISQEVIYAARALGSANSRVTFVGINVNQFHARPADVLAFSRNHYLTRLANWEFLTGSTAQLRRAWHQYLIAVLPSRTGDVTHSELMYFVDPQGRERWLAIPEANQAAVPDWGRAIALVVRHMLG